jgi:hypothetical protein
MNARPSREYIRHPSKIPLVIVPHSTRQQLSLKLNNMSEGGLAFDSPVEFHVNSLIKIKMPSTKPVFKVDAVVQWCRELKGCFEMGVRFLDPDDAFRVRMVEQVCHISEYRKEAQKESGKRMAWNKASEEWIAKNGGTFPY